MFLVFQTVLLSADLNTLWLYPYKHIQITTETSHKCNNVVKLFNKFIGPNTKQYPLNNAYLHFTQQMYIFVMASQYKIGKAIMTDGLILDDPVEIQENC